MNITTIAVIATCVLFIFVRSYYDHKKTGSCKPRIITMMASFFFAGLSYLFFKDLVVTGFEGVGYEDIHNQQFMPFLFACAAIYSIFLAPFLFGVSIFMKSGYNVAE